MRDGFAALMYHELARPGEPLAVDDRGYAVYAVREAEFVLQMQQLAQNGFRGVSVGAALRDTERAAKTIAITFDDGCATDLTAAVPILRRFGFGATFYITTGFLGRRGYMGPDDVRELARAGFEIAAHGVTHRFLSDLPDAEMRAELVDSRATLESLSGGPVVHMSCPGGRHDPRVIAAARAAGYESVATSRTDVYRRGDDTFDIPRIAITDGSSADDVLRAAEGKGLAGKRARAAVLDTAKRLLGNRLYVALRGAAFRRMSDS